MINNLNSILIEGNLTKDPELAYCTNGTPWCRFSVGVNRYYKQDDEKKEEVSFIEISVYGKTAESCAEYLKKGRGVRVVGRLKQDRWKDADGKGRTKVYIVAEHVEFKPNLKRPTDGAEEEKVESAAAEQELAEASSF
jgi:single-strand DNA-binding protein